MSFHIFRRVATPLPLLLAATLAGVTHAATTDIAQVPLITSAPNAVLPNLMFVLDDSGSMDSDYVPDWATSNIFCRSAGATAINSGTFGGTGCGSGTRASPFTIQTTRSPAFRSASINGIAYNPGITYLPPLYANGTSWPTQSAANTSNWTSVKNDAYNVQDTGSTNLVTGYGDVEFCTDTGYTDCLRNGNYVLPGTVSGKNYTTRRSTTASGSGYIATGAPDAPTAEARNFGPHYYAVTPAEYCDAPNLRNCQSTASTTYSYAAPLRWCSSDTAARAATPAAGACQGLRNDTFTQPRFPTKFFTAGTAGTPGTSETAASAQFRINSLNCNVRVSAVTVNGVNLLSANTISTSVRDDLGNSIRDRINSGSSGYTASTTNGGDTVRIQAPPGAGNITYSVSITRTGSCFSINPATPSFSGYVAGTPGTPGTPGGFPGSFTRVEIIPSVASYTPPKTRNDCAAKTSCTYAEEMTNFANWFTYYRTRMQMMKSAASFAFGNLSNNYRVGYMSINNNTDSDFLNLGRFELTHKSDWFAKLTAAVPNNATPLRGTLSTAGRLFGGRLNGETLNGSTVADPMQYSCQQNFTLLSTDGYWNETNDPVRLDGSTAIGDVDSGLPRPLKDGLSPVAENTLADTAAYYYETDLRDGAPTDAICLSGTGADLCTNNVPVGGDDVARHQHMTTFTLGLGVSGYMLFEENYRNATTGDYFDVDNGTAANPSNGVCSWQSTGDCTWPRPVNNSQPNIDDLWHAAVNGRGTYFSAGDPAALYTGLSSALAAIEARLGAAAAATTSTPNISVNDNSVFISSFMSGPEWTGELLGKTLNTRTGDIQTSASDWSAKTQLNSRTPATRTIYTYSAAASNRLKSFEWGNLSTAEKAYFETAHITATGRGLSQFCSFGTTCLAPADQTTAAGQPLVDFIRGDRANEGAANNTAKYFRARVSLLGDIVNSEALYVKRALYNYADAGYAAYKTGTDTRRAMVYVGANDGMLHAFDAADGSEAWAYIPTMVVPNLYRLADKEYGNKHQFFVDGSPVGGDIYTGSAWKTIIVGGLGAGGRGYYALDVTDPNNPQALWEFTDNNLGYTMGKPDITKLKDGTWVVIFASGYNNVSPGDGRGRLFVVRASDGTLLRTIDTGAGDTGTPSGLAQIRTWVDRTDVNNTAQRVYGGDGLGNLWRFDVNNDIGTPGYDAQSLATLLDAGGRAQPLTARPELGLISGNAVVYVGTGRYLGVTDLSDTSVQSIYAIKDPLGSTGWGTPRTQGSFVRQTLTDALCPSGASVCAPTETVRLGTANAVDWATNGGWYIDLPKRAERANTDPQLALGILAITTNVINPAACAADGTSYINFFDYRTGGPLASSTGVVSVFLGNAIATRTTVVGLEGGKVVGLTRLSNAETDKQDLPPDSPGGAARRISWRELTN